MKRIKSAFSIVELSVVLAIVAIIISGAITVSSSALKNAKIKVTKERMAIIQKGLEAYVHTYKRLPCPANLALLPSDATYGVANATAGGICNISSTTPGTRISTDASANTIMYGAVPVRTLGLSIELMADGFGNKFSYAIPNSTTTRSVTETTAPATPQNGFEGSNFGFIDVDTANVINVRETFSSTLMTGNANIVNGKVVYIVISHGPNGYGAVNSNATTQNSTSGAVADEASNYFQTTFDNDFVVYSRDSSFDDIVAYDNRESIIRKIGGFTNTVCTTESSGYAGLCTNAALIVSFPPTFNGATSITTNCATYGCGAGTATRACGTNGQWGAIVNDSCP